MSIFSLVAHDQTSLQPTGFPLFGPKDALCEQLKIRFTDTQTRLDVCVTFTPCRAGSMTACLQVSPNPEMMDGLGQMKQDHIVVPLTASKP